MKVGLIDVDGRKAHGTPFPNLALMKLSAFHKANGDEVEWCFPLSRYDRVYASKVFTNDYTRDLDFDPLTDDFRRGGTGYGLENKLPYEVEHIMPDYSLYGIADTAYGFLSRGCPRGCPFCIVSKKEGRASRNVSDLREWWNGQNNIKLLDPNLLACRDWRDLLGQLEESGANIDITQGLDIRLMDAEKADCVKRLKIKAIHFAWDNANDDLLPKFKEWAECGMKDAHGSFGSVFVLTNYNTTMDENLFRVCALRDLGFEPYAMVYDKPNAPKEILRFQRWVNNKFIFRKCKNFKDYIP